MKVGAAEQGVTLALGVIVIWVVDIKVAVGVEVAVPVGVLVGPVAVGVAVAVPVLAGAGVFVGLAGLDGLLLLAGHPMAPRMTHPMRIMKPASFRMIRSLNFFVPFLPFRLKSA